MLENQPLSVQLAWLAGIIDGEGNIGAYAFPAKVTRRDGSSAYRVRLMVAVTNTNETLIGETTRLFREVAQTNPVVNIHNRPEDHPAWKTSYRVQIVSNGPVTRLLTAILPYLVAKRSQAEVVLGIAGHRGRICAEFGKQALESRVENDTWLRGQLATLRGLNLKGPVKEDHVSL